ncbi:branched-chain amino acid transport system II carrier protein [uncultured Aquimarina sp.]|uniref:branched-chain amino acid transport system II carrier protein n=1 Tax=uncultured Aquimarina sp. TaxID=575652 RepID=UPI002629BD8E|nr:branched-chain amino acid transport system II carrier protein [uncultured Aquimarina sp.]
MRFNKETFITGFALFSMFFGAGNLILPPNLGFKAGDMWFWVTIGFVISAVVLPLFGIFAHAKLQGTMLDFGKKVSPTFSLVYCFIVYAISIALPSPRTASVTHEMAIQPFFGTSSLLTSSVYFCIVLFFVLNRSKILNILGKFLTPVIFIVILSIIFIGIFSTHPPMNSSVFETPVVEGLLEGYQTFDAIGAVVVGGVIIISLQLKGRKSFEENRLLIRNSGIIAGIGLFIVYAGLIFNGALFNGAFEQEISRTELLSGLSLKTLGNIGSTFLSVLVSLACFTTAVGIVTGTADFIKGIFGESHQAYIITAVIGCILGVVMGQLDVHDIIVVAIPALMFIYPITIVLILLNVLPDKFTSSIVFRAVVIVTIIFSLPDFLGSIGLKDQVQAILELIPLGRYSLAWLMPAIFCLIISNVFIKEKSSK